MFWVHARFTLPVRGRLIAVLAVAFACSAPGAEDQVSNQYQFMVSPYHRITDNLTGSGRIAYFDNPDKQSHTYYFSYPNLTYKLNAEAQLWGGLTEIYTDNEKSADKLELRPYAGVKLFVPNPIKWNFYNYTRYEFRETEDLETHKWTGVHRLRSRFGIEAPLTSVEKAWEPGTWYALADVEPFFRFDKDRLDPLRVRGGVGYVVNDRVRVEFIYGASFTRPSGSSSLEYTENTFRFNVRVSLQRGLLDPLLDPNK